MFFRKFIFLCLLLVLQSCSQEGNEELVSSIINAANLDISALDFISTDEDIIISANATHTFTVKGIHSDGSSSVLNNISLKWSLSSESLSTITQAGLITAASNAETTIITASFGLFSVSTNIRISEAKFNSVYPLNIDLPVSVSACQNISLVPDGQYFDDQNNEEIRPVDSLILPTISWSISDTISTSSLKAFIEKTSTGIDLFALASGDININATAFSEFSQQDITSNPFDVTILNDVQSFKLCTDSTSDLATCADVSELTLNTGDTRELIAVASYQSPLDASINYQNITRTSKWGRDSTDLDISYQSNENNYILVEAISSDSTTKVSAACGTVDNEITLKSLSQGIILDSTVNCDTNCMSANVDITIEEITTSSLSVTYNNIALTHNTLETLSTRPSEITFEVSATSSNNKTTDVTTNTTTSYVPIGSSDTILEEQANNKGVYTVIGSGEASIQIEYGSVTFIVILDIPA